VDSDRGTAKFDKSRSSLTVTLPVIPVTEPIVEPVTGPALVTELPAQNDPTELPDGAHNHTESVQADQDTNQPPGAGEPANGGLEASLDWSSTGHWTCPQFSYKQDDSTVSFVLHTPAVNEKSMVANFDKDTVSIL